MGNMIIPYFKELMDWLGTKQYDYSIANHNRQNRMYITITYDGLSVNVILFSNHSEPPLINMTVNTEKEVSENTYKEGLQIVEEMRNLIYSGTVQKKKGD